MLGKTKETYHYKAVLIGKSGVGKTTLLSKWANEDEIKGSKYRATTVSDFRTQSQGDGEGKVIIHLWDTPGNPNNWGVSGLNQNFKDSNAIIGLFSLDDENSLDELNDLLDLCNWRDKFGSAGIILVGIRSDKESLITEAMVNQYVEARPTFKSKFRGYVETNLENITDFEVKLYYSAVSASGIPQETISKSRIVSKSGTKKSTDQAANIRVRLERYTKRLESQRRSIDGYSEGFWSIWSFFGYTPKSRASHRESNHLLAEEFLYKLNKPGVTLATAFNTVFKDVRETGFFISDFKLNKDGREHNINCSSELYGIIKDAKTYSK
jgi:small GTP-binding protein